MNRRCRANSGHPRARSVGFGTSIVVFVCFVALAARGEQVACEANSSLGRGATVTSSLRLTLQGSRVVGLAIDVIESHVVPSGNPMAIWTGGLDTMDASSVGSQQWLPSGDTSFVRIADPGSQTPETFLRISRRKGVFRVSFDRVSAYFRGMARFPKRMDMAENGSRCSAVLSSP